MENITHKDLIDIENVSKEDYDFYLDFFSEGSIELRNCLKTLWDKGLYTTACCKGHGIEESDIIYEGEVTYYISLYAYICMRPNHNILEYLSEELITDPYIHFSRDEFNRDAIYIYGRDRFKKLEMLTRDINTGKKDNKGLIDAYVNKMITSKMLKKSYREYYYDNNFYFDEIKRIEELDDIFFLNHHTNCYSDEEMDKYYEERNKILEMVRTRKINNKMDE